MKNTKYLMITINDDDAPEYIDLLAGTIEPLLGKMRTRPADYADIYYLKPAIASIINGFYMLRSAEADETPHNKIAYFEEALWIWFADEVPKCGERSSIYIPLTKRGKTVIV